MPRHDVQKLGQIHPNRTSTIESICDVTPVILDDAKGAAAISSSSSSGTDGCIGYTLMEADAAAPCVAHHTF